MGNESIDDIVQDAPTPGQKLFTLSGYAAWVAAGFGIAYLGPETEQAIGTIPSYLLTMTGATSMLIGQGLGMGYFFEEVIPVRWEDDID